MESPKDEKPQIESLEAFQKAAIENRKPEDGEGLLFEDIYELKKPFEALLDQMRSKIDSGAYTLLVGDDVSGRIPTLIFREFLRQMYEGTSQKVPEALFFSGHHGETDASFLNQNAEEVAHGIEKRYSGKGDILFITEAIQTGRTLTQFENAFAKLPIKHDVMTIGITGGREKPLTVEEYFKMRNDLQKKFGTTIYSACNGAPNIAYSPDSHPYEGVFNQSKSLHSTVSKNHRANPDHKELFQAVVEESRKDVKLMATMLAEHYRKGA
ncbi:MAG: hypothetical protein PHS53_01940 [Candidatus Pacebacteria bacterium]|nr:hypothetical protein [Candidatus Paceibacterota bacterium]MDD5356887.1 hypothetical protein [Candidatus Paceibacterota bacterium]